MYLKSIEMIGFKSFADRTTLNFEPGMMAIVGPNGCGKSNVSDAIRWVLGEQSPKSLRSSTMTDVIFNGTDTVRPLAMAEVSLTLTDCEPILGIEYHDVTITRRVFRSGEGQYLINRAPCRLKDIQRLFMNTGIGTSSYCVMEQGHIDQILSSRPEDRRSVFEEASGIARFKADRRDALRKLDHTNANLLRLGDIIREVKRQIISLQRQVGKAKRYQLLQQRLLTFDGWLGHLRLAQYDAHIAALNDSLAHLRNQENSLKNQVDGAEASANTIRTTLAQIETRIANAMEAASTANADLARSRECIRLNRERAAELLALSKRDDTETQSARASLEHLHHLAAELKTERARLQSQSASANALCKKCQASLAQHNADIQKIRLHLQSLRSQSLSLDNTIAQNQQDLDSLEANSRNDLLRKERLSSEYQEALRTHTTYSRRLLQLRNEAHSLREETQTAASALEQAEATRQHHALALANAQHQAATLAADISARQAKINLLDTNRAARGFPPGAQHLLDPQSLHTTKICGALARKIRTTKKYQRALETVLRPWLDALLVPNSPDALALVRALLTRKIGSARLLPLLDPHTPTTPTPTTPTPTQKNDPGQPLLPHVKASPDIAPLLARLLSQVRVVPSAADLPPLPLPAQGPDYVTLDGICIRASGPVEIFLPAADESNPLAIEQQLAEWRDALPPLQAQAQTLQNQIASLSSLESTARNTIQTARANLAQRRHAAARAEGAILIVQRETETAARRAAQLKTDLAAIAQTTGATETQRTTLARQINNARQQQAASRAQIAAETERLRLLEEEHTAYLDQTTESRLAALSLRQKCEAVDARAAPLQTRINTLSSLIQNRTHDLAAYQSRIDALHTETASAQARLPDLQARATEQSHLLETARAQRDTQRDTLASSDASLHAARLQYDATRDARSTAELQHERQTLSRQHLLDRLQTDYALSPDAVRALQPPPQDPNSPAPPTQDHIESLVTSLRDKLNAMGPVNLIAIEESQKLEERYAFLSQQNTDLLDAKEKLLALIREIDATTTTLFTRIFEKVNAHFQDFFTRLFGGGTARLSLVDPDNILESGIDIIAKPPGKKTQAVSLLSGGERTLTALALLFSLFKVKPSPFCLTDELDAPLDDSNISRYLDILRSFLDSTQFLVITHNWQTIAAANALYGVTMERRGISQIVSVKFADAIEQAKTQPPTPPKKS